MQKAVWAMTCIKKLNFYKYAALCVYFFAFSIHAATVWVQQAGYFNWYKVGTANKYLATTEVNVPETWAKQEGTYIQCKSSGGANKYWQQGYDCYGKQVAVVQGCDAFVCADDFGWTFDLSKNTVLTCPMVKISKDVAMAYEGLQAGATSCR